MSFNNFSLIVAPNYHDLSKKAANFVYSKWQKKYPKKFVLGLATGRTQVGFRQEFIKLVKLKRPRLANLYLTNLDEYWPLKKNHPNSYFQEMKQNFWDPLKKLNLGFSEKHTFIPNCQAKNPYQEAERFEKLLKKNGGIDLQVLGIGIEGHIGFNEKGSAKNSRTRLIVLDESTREANKNQFSGGKEEVPAHAITLGIANILEAREVLLLANGKKKKAIIKKLIKAGPDKNLPASFLKLHKKVTVMIDKEAYQ